MNVATSRAVLILGLALLAVCGCDCLAQPGIAVAPTALAKQASADQVAADMVLIRGGVVEMGIDRSQVPRLEKLFHVDAPQ